MALYDTALNIVSDVAIECGLSAPSAVYASTDANIVQLRTLLKSVGRGLILKNPWLQCVKEHTFTTTSDDSYDLPADFSTMIDQTGWNRTAVEQFIPASPQTWQYFLARGTQASLVVLFKPHHLTLELQDTHDTGQSIAFEYRSRYWVAEAGLTTPTSDAPNEDDDVIIIDTQLITRALKYKFLSDKGFASEEALRDFRETYENCRSANVVAAPVLSLNGKGHEEVYAGDWAQTYAFGFGSGGLF